MSEKLQIQTRVRRLFHYIDDFQKGIIRVPAFQREFVWSMKDNIALFDSLKNGYPIGSILFWRPGIESDGQIFNSDAEKIGSYYIPKNSPEYFYILDGYQRISTLFGCLVNPFETSLERDDEQWFKKYNLLYNLRDDKFELNKKANFESLQIFQVPLYKFVDGKEFYNFQKELFKANLSDVEVQNYISRYETLSARLVDYQIPSIDIVGGTSVQAVEIFSRVNSTGVRISDDWKISALSYNPQRNFRLGTEIDVLLKRLDLYNFGKIKRNLILQCIVNSFGKVFFDQSNSKTLEELATRNDFIDVTRRTLKSIHKAVDFLYKELCVLNSKLLPYNNQLIFLTNFFNEVDNPSNHHIGMLKRWFWITSYSGYFTQYNLSKQRIAYNHFQKFINGDVDDPLFIDNPSKRFTVAKLPSKIALGSVRAQSFVLFTLNRIKHEFGFNDRVHGYKLIPLFRSSEKDLTSATENQVIFVDLSNGPVAGRLTQLSIWLNSGSDLSAFFITQEMKNAYNAGISVTNILELRKTIINDAEEEFVQLLGLEYDSST
jgi:hypothetical protein